MVTFYFYELTHFVGWMKNTLLFICGTNILVRLLTTLCFANRKYEEQSYPRKCATPSNSDENATQF